MKQKIDKLLHRQPRGEEQAGAFAHKLDGVKWAESDGEEKGNDQISAARENDPLAEVAYRARPGNPFSKDS